jgi:hypothetical protein
MMRQPGAPPSPGVLDRVADGLCRPRPWALLAAVALAVGAVQALAMLPLPLLLGAGDFWTFPRGTVPGSGSDMAQVVVGYVSLVRGPWGLPVLQAPTLLPPAGTNIFWLDAVPLVSLAGKLVFSATGSFVNLLGPYLFACLVLPGLAMAGVLWMAGQRGLVAAFAGAALADAMPFFLFEWGHVALSGHFLVILGLFLYAARLRQPRAGWVPYAWAVLLGVAALTNFYLFTMAGGFWVAAQVQCGLDRLVPRPRLLAEAAATVAVVAALLLAAGILSPELGGARIAGYGMFSMNLASPFVPQLSGVIPPLARYWVGMPEQVFDYLGLGGLVVLLAGAAAALRGARRHGGLRPAARAHAALLVLCLAWYLFALSHRITLGGHLLLRLPLPERLVYAFGAFRAAGRFFWPVGYAAVAAGTVLILRRWPPRAAAVLLLLAAGLQLADVAPQRAAIAASARGPAPPALDRAAAAAVLARSQGVLVFPSFGCEPADLDAGGHPTPAGARLSQAIMEIQLLAARANLPINSVDNARGAPDCAGQRRLMQAPLAPGRAYFYLAGFTPGRPQLAGRDPAEVCAMLDWVRYCLLPP